jgi:hypothetical protein
MRAEQTILHAGFGVKPCNDESQKRHVSATVVVQLYRDAACRPSPEALDLHVLVVDGLFGNGGDGLRFHPVIGLLPRGEGL